MRLILASASPRRAELLTAAGFRFDICATDIDETPRVGESAREYVRRLAAEKAARAMNTLPSAIPATGEAHTDVLVLGADTAVIVDDEILGKPADDRDAERMLRLIAGRSHTVLTGVSLCFAGGHVDRVEETRVWVRTLSNAEVAWYLASGEGRDKAGAYAIQGLASRFIARMDGSYTNVVGLPVAVIDDLIRLLGGTPDILASG